jgi:hypothetical protein
VCYQAVIEGLPFELTPELSKDVQASVNASVGNLYWFKITGNNITLSGNQDPEWGFVDSFGYQWWEAAKSTLPLGGLVRDRFRL